MTPVLPVGCLIELLGAAGTGKSELAKALVARLGQRGLAATRVLQFDDPARYADALAARRGSAITLLMALDLPAGERLDQAATPGRERVDAALRALLDRTGTPFAVIHGRGPERMVNAWNAIHSRAEAADEAAPHDGGASRAGSWACDKCSDPACEHRLFTDLMARRP